MAAELVSSVIVDALRVAVLFAASVPIAWVLTRGPARVRSLLWLAVLAGALLTPALTRLMSPIVVAVPGWVARVPSDIATPSAPDLLVRSRPVARTTASDPRHPDTVAAEVSRVRAERDAGRDLSPVTLVMWVWALGAVALLSRTAAGYWRIARIVARATPVVDPDWSAVLRRAMRRVGCRRRVRLLWTNELDVPATTGVLRPTVLLPRAADRWLMERREVVVMHEVVHVRRLDWAARIVARLVTVLHWFDPLAWWVSSRLEREQERACDEAVLGAGVRASTYAAHLLDIARSARPRPALSVPALELTRRTEVEDRIMHVLESRGWRRSVAVFGLPVLVVIGSLVPAIAAVRPGPQQPEPVVAPQATVATAPSVAVVARADAPTTIAADPEPASPSVAADTPVPPADPELSRLIRDMERLEERMQPSVDEIDESIRLRVEEKIREIEHARLEIDERRLQEIEARIEAELVGIEDLEVDLGPIQAEIEEVTRAIEAIELETALDAEALHEAIEPHVARLQELHLQIEPVHAHMERVHESLEPLYEEMAAVHEEMMLRHGEMEGLHAELEPLQEEIERLHESIEPIREELERTAEQIDAAVAREVEAALRSGMSSVVGTGAPYGEAARRIASDSHIRVRSDVLSVEAPVDETRAILRDLMTPHRIGSEQTFEVALETTVRDLTPLRRSIDLE